MRLKNLKSNLLTIEKEHFNNRYLNVLQLGEFGYHLTDIKQRFIDTQFIEKVNKYGFEFHETYNKSYITTQKLDDFESTTDYNLSLVGVSQLSKNCKAIIGVQTAPSFICLNKWTLENCIKFVNFTHNSTGYDFKNKTTNISDLDSLYEEICSLIKQT